MYPRIMRDQRKARDHAPSGFFLNKRGKWDSQLPDNNSTPGMSLIPLSWFHFTDYHKSETLFMERRKEKGKM